LLISETLGFFAPLMGYIKGKSAIHLARVYGCSISFSDTAASRLTGFPML
jgi:hypothetical protein